MEAEMSVWPIIEYKRLSLWGLADPLKNMLKALNPYPGNICVHTNQYVSQGFIPTLPSTPMDTKWISSDIVQFPYLNFVSVLLALCGAHPSFWTTPVTVACSLPPHLWKALGWHFFLSKILSVYSVLFSQKLVVIVNSWTGKDHDMSSLTLPHVPSWLVHFGYSWAL